MSEFKRSSSKVWWANESLDFREMSDSRCSQDSGFSDTELPQKKYVKDVSAKLTKETFIKVTTNQNPKNLSSNYQTKSISNKNISTQLTSRCRFVKSFPAASRNLFTTQEKKNTKDVSNNNQYSQVVPEDITHSTAGNNDICRDSRTLVKEQDSQALKEFNTLKLTCDKNSSSEIHSLSSDCESELEDLFNGTLEYTSTPKTSTSKRMLFSINRTAAKLPLKCENLRTMEISHDLYENALHQWLREVKTYCEQECTTTLHSKSIVGELHQKVAFKAAYTVTNIKSVLVDADCIEREYKNAISSEKKHIGSLAQSLVGNIIDFLRKHCRNVNKNMSKQYDVIRKSPPNNLLKLITPFYDQWKSIFQDTLTKEITILLEKLENPCSDLDLRATVTGITSICLERENLIDLFTKGGAVPILIILCEKCEGSSIRSLLLRALATMCSNTLAVEQFGKFSGIQIINDTLCDELSRPEPERSEAVAVLVQVTAPWREDNHSITSLSDYSPNLVKSLTKFIATTKCCQNILLCAAALANLSELDSGCISYILRLNTIQILLEAVNKRGPCVSVYLLEQAATLIVNLTSHETARKDLMKSPIISALLCFLRVGNVGEDVEKRLQQKSIIALSRLCSQPEACRQVVTFGGIEKLVKMCREKNERFSSDAVLVATLATLRKIVDACGKQIMSSEDVQELVAPKLLDSFLTYSTQSESYV